MAQNTNGNTKQATTETGAINQASEQPESVNSDRYHTTGQRGNDPALGINDTGRGQNGNGSAGAGGGPGGYNPGAVDEPALDEIDAGTAGAPAQPAKK